ncbi:MAG: hypothetical protein JHD16_00635 [Solirubrobacteraceae bacterium]|nr:hypothetical protein [Solirubrobacteraceae bacterium]
MNKAAVVLALLLGLSAVTALAWIASSSRYQGCVAAAEARTPVVATQGAASGYDPLNEGTPLAVSKRAIDARRAAVNNCSQFP